MSDNSVQTIPQINATTYTVQQLILAELRVITTLMVSDPPLANLEALDDLRSEILGDM